MIRREFVTLLGVPRLRGIRGARAAVRDAGGRVSQRVEASRDGYDPATVTPHNAHRDIQGGADPGGTYFPARGGGPHRFRSHCFGDASGQPCAIRRTVPLATPNCAAIV